LIVVTGDHAAKQKRIASDSAIAPTRTVERQNLFGGSKNVGEIVAEIPPCWTAITRQIVRSGVSLRRRASSNHCTARKPSKASGINRFQPNARPARIATLRTFGSISALQERYGIAKDQVRKDVDAWPNSLD
jgi:hypothetical protein